MNFKYNEDEIISKLNVYSKDISNLYKKDIINYKGNTSDTKIKYTEVISKWLLDNIYLLENIKKIKREKSYKISDHKGISLNINSNRKEELIAMEIFKIGKLPLIGKILDYQTPLKNKRYDEAGKIDIVSIDDNNIVHILELKKDDSRETMLRSVLEIYTYFRTIDIKKFLLDFNLDTSYSVECSPLVYFGGFQYKELKRYKSVFLKKFMNKLNIKPFYYIKENNSYRILQYEFYECRNIKQ